MRIVVEVGDWVLAEDDDGEVRLWSNGVTGETRSYEDVPKEVEAALSSDDGPPLTQPAAEAPQQPHSGANAQPFRRACGVGAEPAVSSSALAGSAEAAPFSRQRGLAAATSQHGSALPEPQGPPKVFGSELLTSTQEYVGSAAVDACQWAEDKSSGGGVLEPEAQTEATQEQFEHGRPTLESAADKQAPSAEPDPVVTRPANVPELPPREPTQAMLMKATTTRPHHSQSQEQFLAKLTHLHLAERGFTSLGRAFHLCPRLKVLNLERNQLQELSGLRPGCEVLHLQGNNVWDLSGWTQHLPSMATLDLAENRLTVLSGLRSSTQLQELSVRGQRSDKPLQLHSPTLLAFSRSLRSLNISRNRMTDADFAPVVNLRMLQRLDASGNMLADMAMLGTVLQALSCLTRLSLEGNPVCWMRKCRDLVIVAASECLEELDGKAVQPNERPFLVELHQRRRRRNSSEPPKRGATSPGGSTPTALSPTQTRSASVGRGCHPRPPREQPPPPVMDRNRSRSSSVDPAARHYRRKSGPTTKLPPLPPRI